MTAFWLILLFLLLVLVVMPGILYLVIRLVSKILGNDSPTRKDGGQ